MSETKRPTFEELLEGRVNTVSFINEPPEEVCETAAERRKRFRVIKGEREDEDEKRESANRFTRTRA